MSEEPKFVYVQIHHPELLIYEDIMNIAHAEGEKEFKRKYGISGPVFIWEIQQFHRLNKLVLAVSNEKPVRHREVGRIAERVTKPS